MAVQAKYKQKLQVNMTEEIAEEVKRLADVQGVSNAEIIRQALEAGLPFVRSYKVDQPSVPG